MKIDDEDQESENFMDHTRALSLATSRSRLKMESRMENTSFCSSIIIKDWPNGKIYGMYVVRQNLKHPKKQAFHFSNPNIIL
jgi:hypothetical protein